MKKFNNTLSRTMEMMISPPIRSPNARDALLAIRRMMISGLATKRRKLKRAAKRDSCTKLFGP